MRVSRALVSVSDKTGLEDFARGLADAGITIVSTGGTAESLRSWGIDVVAVDEVTGHPEIMGGRVKTLHPRIHGGILGRAGHEGDAREMAENGIEPIDLVVVNLYPFEEWARRRGVSDDELIEQIDIGGPTLIRAAAKNHSRVGVVTSPDQYAEVLGELAAGDGELSPALRRRLAGAAFLRTASYDAAISSWFAEADEDEGFPASLLMGFDKAMDLSYGENPHQRGAYYTERGARTHLLARVEQLHGKALSFNNLFDLDAARGVLAEFELPACVIVKHNNPCGVAVGSDVRTAYERARDCDPVSAYGGVIAVNRPVDPELGELLAGTFVEVLCAPGFDEAALASLTRKPNTRLMLNDERRRTNAGERDLRRVVGGVLVQDRDAESEDRSGMTVVTDRAPTEAEWGDLLFAWRVAKHVKSNAIVLARDLVTVGVGAGQMSRVDSVRLSLDKAQSPVAGAVLASDAFFPFADGPEAAVRAGVTAIIQPGGSIRDDEVFAACDAAGVAMVVTGRRHFRH
ncbi:bifunctional phosphoribosylaminoimidazolecarboxamide formyltransferase/IMP cyclohydrolase [Miltoncostaea oceani]|uniref:bifunctional phosphoribosylaminoimidazolecarboxamide formyltransferase/IMP cyclohydrolase n=1 Tax=Miltoncostaea oceani TaxID=2843216 RepID=UPI001C3DA6BF|nr:bifunctional phosphoribosylaminoimidazolecarboxamide formyltransferase/IMP cyclohydrolase [Miltoncostaea oceani]